MGPGKYSRMVWLGSQKQTNKTRDAHPFFQVTPKSNGVSFQTSHCVDRKILPGLSWFYIHLWPSLSTFCFSWNCYLSCLMKDRILCLFHLKYPTHEFWDLLKANRFLSHVLADVWVLILVNVSLADRGQQCLGSLLFSHGLLFMRAGVFSQMQLSSSTECREVNFLGTPTCFNLSLHLIDNLTRLRIQLF